MKQSLSIIIGVIIIAVVAYLAFWYTNTSPQIAEISPSPLASVQMQNEFTEVAPSTSPSSLPSTSPAATTVAVSLTDTGFEPATVTVPVGTTVVFTNNGQAAHWPASDPHPLHTGLPGFDAKKGLATGETYSFTFTKVGTFGVHDHLMSSLKGSIVVQ